MDRDPGVAGGRAAVDGRPGIEPLAWAAAGIAHDVNNLLATAVGALEAVAEALPAGEALRVEVEVALDALARAAALLTDLTDLAVAPSHPTAVDLAALVLGLEPLLRRVAGGASLELRVAADAGLVDLDPRHLERILVNLVANAGRAAGSGGRVTVSVVRLVVPPVGLARWPRLPAGAWAVMEVADNGPGMAKIRGLGSGGGLAPATTPSLRREGNEIHGLGLSNVAGLVARAGGVLEVVTDGGGTTARVAFPLASGMD
jgi:signal transduction histidine kinase